MSIFEQKNISLPSLSNKIYVRYCYAKANRVPAKSEHNYIENCKFSTGMFSPIQEFPSIYFVSRINRVASNFEFSDSASQLTDSFNFQVQSLLFSYSPIPLLVFLYNFWRSGYFSRTAVAFLPSFGNRHSSRCCGTERLQQ